MNSEDILLPPEPLNRAAFFPFYCRLTLDPNTAYREMVLSEGDRRVTLTDLVQTYPDRPERFTHLFQVLCREGLSGRCYWEVEWSGSVEIAVAYKDMGNESAFGCNDKSWSLDYDRNGSCFRHDDVETPLSDPQSSRVGVYLDYEAGSLSFYSISDASLILVHSVHTTFTEPLYPGFWVADTAELCEVE